MRILSYRNRLCKMGNANRKLDVRRRELPRSAIPTVIRKRCYRVKESPPQKPLTKKRLKNLILNVVKNPFNMIVLVSLVILFCLIIIPLLTMIATTFTAGQAEVLRIGGWRTKVGDFTLYYWTYMLASNMSKAVLWEPLFNLLIIGACVVIISVPLGSVLAG